ncbi:hypothetical protein HMPREF5505_0702 [Lactobacillus delbrueckii subsp. lactis DSM 20072]|nr:hypothetical protein HMPREF5505_0702 [Lactobacillus delbrueckii subsp. lactis DSM 20072]
MGGRSGLHFGKAAGEFDGVENIPHPLPFQIGFKFRQREAAYLLARTFWVKVDSGKGRFDVTG